MIVFVSKFELSLYVYVVGADTTHAMLSVLFSLCMYYNSKSVKFCYRHLKKDTECT